MWKNLILWISCCLMVVCVISNTGCDKDEPVGPEPDTTPPPPVTNLVLTQQQLGLFIDWDVPLIDDQPVPDLKGYYVRRDPGFAADSVFALESSYLDRSVSEGASYVYTVTAVDDSLNESTPLTSSAMVFDTRRPLVTIISPVPGYVTNQSLLTVQGTVVDSQTIASATIIVNDGPGSQVPVTAGAFSGQVSLEAGVNTIQARATDPSGNTGSSAEVSVRLDTAAVIVQILQPADGIITREERVAVSGVVSDQTITTGTLLVNGNGSTVAVVNGQFVATATLEEGTNVIRVTASNQAGTSGDSGPIEVIRDSQAPQVRLIQPLDGAPFQESPIFVSGTVTDANPPDSVTLNASGTVSKLILSEGQFQAWSELNEGPNQIVVSAIDLAENSGSAAATVYLNSYGPTVRITTPAGGALLNNRVVEIGGTVTDPAIIDGTLFVNGTPQIIAIQSGIFLVSVTVGTDGTHRFWLEVVDQYNRPGVSDTVQVTVDTTPPVLTITSPANGSIGNSPSISVSGQIDDVDVTNVTVMVNGFGVQTTPRDGAFSAQATLVEGANAMVAVATDAAGNAGASDTTRVTLDTQAQIAEVGHNAAGLVLNVGDQVRFWVNAGEPDGSATVDIGTVHTGIALYDDGTHGDTAADDGLYAATYTVAASDEAFQVQVIGYFTDRVGNVALAQTASAPITINAPPGAVTLVQPDMTQVTSKAVYLRWTASTIPDFRDYRLYRKTSSGVDTTAILVTTVTTIGQDSVFYTDRSPGLTAGQRYYYRVYVRDQLGASAASDEVSAVIDSWPSEQTLSIQSGDYPAYMAKLAVGPQQYVYTTHMSNPGMMQVVNFSTDTQITTFQVNGSTVGVSASPYVAALAAGWDARGIYGVGGNVIELTGPIDVRGQPWDVDSAWGPGDTLFSFSGVGDSMAVVNLWTAQLAYKFHTSGIPYAHVGASPDRHTIYAATPTSMSGVIAKVNPLSWAIDATYTGFRPIFDMIVTEDYLLLTHRDDRKISVVRRWDMQLLREVSISGRPTTCALPSANSRYLYISCTDDHLICIVDTTTWQQIDQISLWKPFGLLCDDQGTKVYVCVFEGNGSIVVFK